MCRPGQCGAVSGCRPVVACFEPLTAYQAREVNGEGVRPLSFSARLGYERVQLPCGQCLGCKRERARQWAVRLMHECQMHEVSCFVTLTYDDAHLPAGGNLRKRHFQDFMRRLRATSAGPVRYFHCGEYGENFGRPHYHAILFGVDFADKVLFKRSPTGDLFTSEALSKLWSFGFASVGNVTFESCRYVAQYCVKKVTGKGAKAHYQKVDPATGEIVFIQPEYVTMSRKPGIGAGWFDKFSGDVFPSDEVVVSGKVGRPPRYYFKKLDEAAAVSVRELRRAFGDRQFDDNSPRRLRDKAEVAQSKMKFFRRDNLG